ncbi:cyclin domain-containing protein, partial [Heterostelium album PN500]
RGSGDTEREDAQKILEISSMSLNPTNKRHSGSVAGGGGSSTSNLMSASEMKPLNESKRNSIKSKITISEDDSFSLTAKDSSSVLEINSEQQSLPHYYMKPVNTLHSSYPSTHQRQLSTGMTTTNTHAPAAASTSSTSSSTTMDHSYLHFRHHYQEKVGLGPQFKTPITSIPQHMRMEGFQRAKHNSTSSLYIKSTLSTPDNDEILRCMANALLYHIERGTQTPQKHFEIFSEEKYPITLDSECAIMCLAYVERVITFSGATINSTNWRRIVLSALILASKVWEDQSVWNVDFLPVFDNLTAADLNNLERQFLSLIQYNVSLTASTYAKYYFELRTFSKLDSTHFPLKPLDKIGAKRLEDHSQASEYRVKTFKRSASVDQINPPEPHTRAVLN